MSAYTVVTCPKCGAKTNLESDASEATCQFCGAALVITPESRPVDVSGEMAEVYTPKGITVARTAEGLVITRRWFGLKSLVMAVFTVIIVGLTIGWFSVFSQIVWIQIMVVVVLLYLIYSSLSGILNMTTITVAGDTLTVKHAPLPWFGGGRYTCSDFTELHTREVIRRSKNTTTRTYTLLANRRDGRKVNILSGLDSSESCRFIEEQLEEYLHLSASEVSGEVSN